MKGKEAKTYVAYDLELLPDEMSEPDEDPMPGRGGPPRVATQDAGKGYISASKTNRKKDSTGKTSTSQQNVKKGGEKPDEEETEQRDKDVWTSVSEHCVQHWVIYIILSIVIVGMMVLKWKVDQIQSDIGPIISELELIRLALHDLKTPTSGDPLDLFVRTADYSKYKQDIEQKLQTVQGKLDANKENNIPQELRHRLVELENDRGIIPSLDNNLTEIKDRLKDYEALTSDVNALKTDTVIKLQEDIDAASDTVNKLADRTEKELQDAKERLNQATVEIDQSLEQMKIDHKEKIEKVKQHLDGQYDDLDKQYRNTKGVVEDTLIPNAFNKDAVIQALLLLVMLFVTLAFYLSRQRHPPAGQNDGAGSGGLAAENHDEPVSPTVHKIPSNQPLQNAICVVSFDENTQTIHRKLVKQVLNGLSQDVTRNCPTEYHVVCQHDDILRLPPTKLYLMFVDYSERHIIIEEPNLGLGDNRRTTVQAIRKRQADYVIIYVHDLGSRKLANGKHYNREIYCVQGQPTLKVLSRQGRFFSVYDNLTDFQRQCIQSVIEEIFED